MSDRMMTVALARRLSGSTHVGLAVPAARTIVAQAEQIERLQAAVGEAVSTSGDGVDDLIAEGIILPSDMEAPK